MTLTQSDVNELLAALRAGGDIDVIRKGVELVLQALIEAEASDVIGAARYERSDTRTTQRNGSRDRLLTTKAGDVQLKIPKLRRGSFFPSILERRRRINLALFAVVMEAYVHGVSTRKVDDPVAAQGAGAGISRSEVSRICAGLDDEMAAFRARSLGHVEFPYVFADATYLKGRIGGQVVSRPVVATGVAMTGGREVLGCAVGDTEDESFWTEFFRSLRTRGLHGVRLVISDHHRQGVHRRRLAAVSGALHAQRVGQGHQDQRPDGGRRHPHHLRPGRRRRGGLAVRAHRGHSRARVRRRGGHAHRRPR